MIIVSDTSPVSALIQLGLLDILPQLFGSIVIPPSVERELLFLENQGVNLSAFKKASWITVQTPTNTVLLKQLLHDLDSGEAEAITLAKELSAQFLLIDEKKGRKVAETLHIPIVGLLGILLYAKRSGILVEIRPIILKLKSIDFFASTSLLNKVLRAAGESSV